MALDYRYEDEIARLRQQLEQVYIIYIDPCAAYVDF